MSVPIGAVEDLTPGEGRAYVVDGKQVAVFLLGDGSVRAIIERTMPLEDVAEAHRIMGAGSHTGKIVLTI